MSSDAKLRAGAAEVTITPPVGVELAGHGFGPSVGVLDDLQAQALVLECGDQRVAILAAELLTFGREFVGRVRGRISYRLGIRGEATLLAATHGHSSPTAKPLRQWGVVDPAYVAALEAYLVGAADMATRNLATARVSWGSGRVLNIAENRRGEEGLVDPSVPVLRIDRDNGEPLAVLYAFGCHPVALHSYRNLIAPDYPGYARQTVQGVLGDRTVVSFLLGAAGDVNPAGYVAGTTHPGRARQIGAILGCEVAKVALDPHPVSDPCLDVRTATVLLPTADLPSTEELHAIRRHASAEIQRLRKAHATRKEMSVHQVRQSWATDALRARTAGNVHDPFRCEIQAIRIGDTAIVALPVELFTATGLAIRDPSPARVTLICSNANGTLGYLPTADAYQTDDYTNPQGLAPKVYGVHAMGMGAEAIVRDAAIELLSSLFD